MHYVCLWFVKLGVGVGLHWTAFFIGGGFYTLVKPGGGWFVLWWGRTTSGMSWKNLAYLKSPWECCDWVGLVCGSTWVGAWVVGSTNSTTYRRGQSPRRRRRCSQGFSRLVVRYLYRLTLELKAILCRSTSISK